MTKDTHSEPNPRVIKVGEFIRQARQRKGWSMQVLKEKTGLSLTTVQNMELSRHAASPLTYTKLEQVLEWRSGSIMEALTSSVDPDDITMDWFATPPVVEAPLARAPISAADLTDEELLRELSFRLLRAR